MFGRKGGCKGVRRRRSGKQRGGREEDVERHPSRRMVYLCDIHTVAEHVAEQGVNHLLVLRLQKVLHVRDGLRQHAAASEDEKNFKMVLCAAYPSVRPVKPL